MQLSIHVERNTVVAQWLERRLGWSISQMDVPTRQSYTMAVVSAEEPSAAAGITGVVRTTGAAISALFVGSMFARPSLIDAPFIIAGMLKIIYDLLLYREFVGLRPPEEASWSGCSKFPQRVSSSGLGNRPTP